jgi:hypothetical protein
MANTSDLPCHPARGRVPIAWSLFTMALLAAATLAAAQPAPPLLPDPKLSPGDTLAVTTDDICTPGYTKKVRNVPAAVKRQVYAEYGITSHKPGEYEVDHLISLELGGSNSIRNLWPESYKTQPWNARVKDHLENELHRLVCSGQLDLKTAQHDIATDWIAAYKKYFHTDQPKAARGRRGRARSSTTVRPSTTPSPSDGNAQVWVNTRSGKYFFPASRYYGKTKEGQYMSEAEAKRKGYAPARSD